MNYLSLVRGAVGVVRFAAPRVLALLGLGKLAGCLLGDPEDLRTRGACVPSEPEECQDRYIEECADTAYLLSKLPGCGVALDSDGIVPKSTQVDVYVPARLMTQEYMIETNQCLISCLWRVQPKKVNVEIYSCEVVVHTVGEDVIYAVPTGTDGAVEGCQVE